MGVNNLEKFTPSPPKEKVSVEKTKTLRKNAVMSC
jgi:hypothetical protein